MTFEGEQERGKPPLITLAELARRWEISEKEAIEMVRHRAVPFIRMSHSIGRVRWEKVRFSLASIEAWERTSQEKFRGGPVPPPCPAPRPTARARSKESRLGNWRDPSSAG